MSAPPCVVSVITRLADGGSERRLFDVLAATPDHEHTIIVGGESNPDAVAALAATHTVEWLPDLVRDVSPTHDSRAFTRLVARLRALRPDIVHTHQSKAGLIGRVAARAAGAPIVFHSASMASFGPGYSRTRSRAFSLAERTSRSLVARYFVVGHDLAAKLHAVGVKEDQTEIVRSSIDLDRFAAARDGGTATARQALDLAPDAKVVCFVGALSVRKGVLDLPPVLAQVRDHLGIDVVLLLAGQGPARPDLEAALAGRGLLASTRFLGYTDRVPQVMAASDLLILPSRAEGLPQVLVQAGTVGLPFAAYDLDGVTELLDLGAVGIMAPAENAGALARAACLLLRSGSQLRRPLPDETLQGWSRAVISDQYAAAYRQVGRPMPTNPSRIEMPG